MLKIHFLNVGHGDCIIIENLDTDRVTIVDINRECNMDSSSMKEVYESISGKTFSSFLLEGTINKQLLEKAGYSIDLQDPIDYLNEKDILSIHRFISTHPHMDHMTGISSLKNNITNLWIVKNSYSQNIDQLSEMQKEDWAFYKKYRDTQENKLDGITVIRPEEGHERDFFTEDGIYILSPNDGIKAVAENNANELSYVLLVKHAGISILLPGDAEEKTWDYLVENYAHELQNVDILKAAHHGRDSGYHQEAVKLMSPLVTIVSVGKKPSTDSSNKYRQYCDNVWSTRWKGNIVLTIKDDGKIEYEHQYDR